MTIPFIPVPEDTCSVVKTGPWENFSLSHVESEPDTVVQNIRIRRHHATRAPR